MKIIDGKKIAQEIREAVKADIARLGANVPGLAVIIVGNDKASHLYVRNKVKACQDVGIKSFKYDLPADTNEEQLLQLIDQLNLDDKINGILVQLPLPKFINATRIINRIDQSKDVDGLTIVNVGKLATGQDCFVPCTPQGCLLLIKTVIEDLSGLNALIVGRSNLVGKPMLHVLLQENATVTIAHSKTNNLKELCLKADILVAAIGSAELIKGEWIKPGAIVIDVGISYKDGEIKGDVEFEEAVKRASYITPVPGGAGPMTVACLLKNTVKAAFKKFG